MWVYRAGYIVELFSHCRYFKLPAEWEPPKKQEFKEIVSDMRMLTIFFHLLKAGVHKRRNGANECTILVGHD
jgi:predicted transcriptional regulator